MTLIRETEVKPDGTTIYRTIEESARVSVFDWAQDNEDHSVKVPEKDETPFRLEFVYAGKVRLVENPSITEGAYNYRSGYNVLLKGFEVSRDGELTGTPKFYNLSQIRPI